MGSKKMRFDNECRYKVSPPPAASEKAMGSVASFFTNWVLSASDFVQLYGNIWLPITLPLFYGLGLLYILLKFFVLNPPFLQKYQSRFDSASRWMLDFLLAIIRRMND